MKYTLSLCFLLISFITFPSIATAGDAATIVFKEGYIAKTNYGFKIIAEAFKNQKNDPKILDLNLEGGTFLLNISEVVIVCRDECPGLNVSDPRKSNKTENR